MILCSSPRANPIFQQEVAVWLENSAEIGAGVGGVIVVILLQFSMRSRGCVVRPMDQYSHVERSSDHENEEPQGRGCESESQCMKSVALAVILRYLFLNPGGPGAIMLLIERFRVANMQA